MRYGWIALLIAAAACGDNLKAPADAAPDMPGTTCGNGVVDSNEQCDEGDQNGTPGGKCKTNCSWTCLDDGFCTDNDPCNGSETCVDHACVTGTPLADGASCGTGKLCRNQACADAACGDSFTTAPNE